MKSSPAMHMVQVHAHFRSTNEHVIYSSCGIFVFLWAINMPECHVDLCFSSRIFSFIFAFFSFGHFDHSSVEYGMFSLRSCETSTFAFGWFFFSVLCMRHSVGSTYSECSTELQCKLYMLNFFVFISKIIRLHSFQMIKREVCLNVGICVFLKTTVYVPMYVKYRLFSFIFDLIITKLRDWLTNHSVK